MKDLLAPRQLTELKRLASTRSLLAFDFDGTLAPLVPDPALAVMQPSTRRLLTKVARLYPCAIISGRAQPLLVRLFAGVPVAHLIGNHGAEWPERDTPRRLARLASVVARWRALLGSSVTGLPGVFVEDKGYSLSLHYRFARRRAATLAQLEKIAAALPSCRAARGILTLNLMPDHSPNKGHALRRLMASSRAEMALFVGDDLTDEDAFALGSRIDLVAVRVRRSARSHAGYYLRSQESLDELLRVMWSLRRARS